MGNKGGKELALVRSSPEDPCPDEDEEFERAVSRDAGWLGQLVYWWRPLRWPRAVSWRWKINNEFFRSTDLVTLLAVVLCVLCIYTLRKDRQQQQNYEKEKDQFLQAANRNVTEFQRAKSELQAATLRMQASATNKLTTSPFSISDTTFNNFG